MEYTLQTGKQSNYQVTITLTGAELLSFKESALQQFQKDANIEGFRPGHAPLSMVEQRVSPEYLKIAMYEEALHQATQKMLEEHPDKRFIGQIYNLNIDDAKDEAIKLNFAIDIYPEVIEKDSAWKKETVQKIATEATSEEIADTMLNLRKQYANYEPATQVGPQSVFKVSLSFVDKSDKEVHTGKLYLGKEDIEEFPQLSDYFMGKKEHDVVTIAYDEKQLPPTMHTNKADVKADHIKATIGDIKDMELPEFTSDNLKKFFGNDDVKTQEELQAKVKTLIEAQKEEVGLMQLIDGYLQGAMKSFSITIPKTLIDEETKTRMKSLQERMGGEEGLKKYFEQLGEDEVKKLQTSIHDAAQQSLEKFLILREIVEKLDIKDVQREQHLDVEKKLYEKIVK